MSSTSKKANNKKSKIFLSQILSNISKTLISKYIYKMHLMIIIAKEKILTNCFFRL